MPGSIRCPCGSTYLVLLGHTLGSADHRQHSHPPAVSIRPRPRPAFEGIRLLTTVSIQLPT
jgi:hypothetical protein